MNDGLLLAGHAAPPVTQPLLGRPAAFLLPRPMASPLDPRRIPGLGLWLDFSNAATLAQNSDGTQPTVTSDSPVGHAADRSGNSRHFTQTVNNNRPLLKLSARNNLSAVYFDGVNDVLNGTAAARSVLRNATGATVFSVRRLEIPATASVWQTDVALQKGVPGGNARLYIGLQSTNPASSVRAIAAVANVDAGGSGNIRYALSSFDPRAAWHEWMIASVSVTYSALLADAVSYWFNAGGSTAWASTMDVAANASNTDSISAQVGLNCTGWIGEVLVWPRALSAAERREVLLHLSQKWSISL